MSNFIYVIEDVASKLALVVDPAWDAIAIESLINKESLTLVGVLLTHSHDDHINALPNLEKTNPNLPVYLTKDEYGLEKIQLRNPNFIVDNQIIKLGNSEIKCIFTPGHTLGGTCFLIEDNLITGDTLFVYGCGRCDLNGSDVNAMFESLQKIKNFPDNTIIYSGHNYGSKASSNLLEQKQGNPFLMIDNLEQFIKFRLDLHSKYRKSPYSAMTEKELKALLNKS